MKVGLLKEIGRRITTDDCFSDKEQLHKERLLLDKQREVIQRQASEMREEYRRMQNECATVEKGTIPKEMIERKHIISDFIDLKDDNGYAVLLRNAMNFYETRDGCPFIGERCNNGEAAKCRGIWIKMGATCQIFADNIKRCIKDAAGTTNNEK